MRSEDMLEAETNFQGCAEPRFSRAPPLARPDGIRLFLIFRAQDSFYEQLLNASYTWGLCQLSEGAK